MSKLFLHWAAALIGAGCLLTSTQQTQAVESSVEELAREVAPKGWILYSAKTKAGDYDLWLARPDGSQVRNLTQSPDFSEFGGRFSRDGKQMLYRRMPRGDSINHDLWGAVGTLVTAGVDGSAPVAHGKDGDYPWASWSPDLKRIACLYKREGKIRIFDLASHQVVKEMPRQGIFQQMYWSPDGRHLCGTANVQGQDWKIVSIDIESGKITVVSRNLSCTPDWFQHDAGRLIYSSRTPGLGHDYGWTMLMQASADGQDRTLIYGERGRHLYYGCTSPDDRYAIFSLPVSDGGTEDPLAVIRMADAPIVVPADYKELRALYPQARSGPVLRLNLAGFEPHWTFAEIPVK